MSMSLLEKDGWILKGEGVGIDIDTFNNGINVLIDVGVVFMILKV